MKHLKITLLLLFLAHCSIAQVFTIKGAVKDTLNDAPLPMSSVVLINTRDSVITAFTRADSAGTFVLSVGKEGKYILRIAFPGFADYSDPIIINKEFTDLHIIPMLTRERLLKEFVLTKQVAAIKIKGDTTEYVADSFKTKEGANVESLLKRLPGIEVDKDGKITAQGETVQKVLVDGEEFFSDDPKVVTKGLQASVVDKVQVYDKKSDQAEFTGIDDGQKTKTINLQLKEDKKKGFFGKLDEGVGTDGYYQSQNMLNAFKGKRQLTAFAIASNTDKVGLGWQDNDKFGGSEMVTDDEGNTYSIGNNDDATSWDGTYSGQGLPRALTGGLHFADKWNADKDHASGNYRYGRQQVDILGNTITQYALNGDTSNINNATRRQANKQDKHSLDLLYERKLDSNTSVKITAGAGHKETDIYSSTNAISLLHTALIDDTLYRNQRTNTNNSNADFLISELLFRKKFKKKGRTISLDVKENYKTSMGDGHLYSSILYDAPGSIDSVVDQAKKTDVSSLYLSGKATYTEPLTKILNLEADYGVSVNNTLSDNLSFNKNAADDRYTRLDSLYSSNYQYNIFTNTGGLNLRWTTKKLNISAGSDVSLTHYLQRDLFADTTYQYNYLNFAPKASFKYKVSNQKTIQLNYFGNTQQPTIAQVQPVRQNTDPTNIMDGNPSLKQAFNNRLNLSYNNYKVLTHKWLYASMNARYTSNAISAAITNIEGINHTQYVNTPGSYGMSGYIGGGMRLGKTELQLNINVEPAVNHSINYVNGHENVNNNNSCNIGFRINMYKEDKFEFSIEPNIAYYDNHATVSTYSTSYWMSTSSAEASVHLPKKFEIGSDVGFMFRQRTTAFPTNNDVIKWNAYVSKKLLKKDQLEVRLSIFDILNRNLGYDRTPQGNIITQDSYNTIRRYGLLNVIWNFSHRPGETDAPAAEDK